MKDTEEITTECVKFVGDSTSAFEALLHYNNVCNELSTSSLKYSTVNLVFFDAHLSCHSLGFECEAPGAGCGFCAGTSRYPAVIARYTSGKLENVIVLPSEPVTFGVSDILIGPDVHRHFLPYLPTDLGAKTLMSLAKGCVYSMDVYQEAVRGLNGYGAVARQLAGNRKDYGFSDDMLYQLPLLALGLTGEAGEVANIVKKYVRNTLSGGKPPKDYDVVEEIGDVLWYCAAILDILEYDIEEAMLWNISKLEMRKLKGQIATEERGEVDLGNESDGW